MRVIIAGDFNISLHTGARGDVLHDFILEFGLTIANSEGPADAEENWMFRSSFGKLRRIDFILHSSYIDSSDVKQDMLDRNKMHIRLDN